MRQLDGNEGGHRLGVLTSRNDAIVRDLDRGSIAISGPEETDPLLAIGIAFVTVFTAFIHLGVVIGLLPNTGLTLPFVSYGRSNLVLTLMMTGILVNIGSDRERVYGASATDPLVAMA